MVPHRSLFACDAQTPVWRVLIIHKVAEALGVLVHIKGLPVGSARLQVRHPEAYDVEAI